MVRRGSAVRVRQRALQKRRKSVLLLRQKLARFPTCRGHGALCGAFRSRTRRRKRRKSTHSPERLSDGAEPTRARRSAFGVFPILSALTTGGLTYERAVATTPFAGGMLPSTYPEAATLPAVRQLLGELIDMQFADLRVLLRLRPDATQPRRRPWRRSSGSSSRRFQPTTAPASGNSPSMPSSRARGANPPCTPATSRPGNARTPRRRHSFRIPRSRRVEPPPR
jgi:hypothetical protein